MARSRPAGASTPPTPTTPPPTGPARPRGRAPKGATAGAARHPQRLLQRHAEERIDPAWSAEAERAFARDLAELARERSFRVVGVECRTASCRADLEWPSFDA